MSVCVCYVASSPPSFRRLKKQLAARAQYTDTKTHHALCKSKPGGGGGGRGNGGACANCIRLSDPLLRVDISGSTCIVAPSCPCSPVSSSLGLPTWIAASAWTCGAGANSCRCCGGGVVRWSSGGSGSGVVVVVVAVVMVDDDDNQINLIRSSALRGWLGVAG